jgi:hypothetical protein
MTYRRENLDSVKSASSEDASAGGMQARLAAMVDPVDDAMVGKTLEGNDHKREPGGGADLLALHPVKWPATHLPAHSFIRIPQAGETRAGNKIRALKLVK